MNNKRLKLSALALLIAAPALTIRAQTNLLQAVTVAFTVYTQGTPVVTSSGTNNVVNHSFFGSKDLIRAVSVSNTFNPGDMLARATPITNVVVDVTNLAPVGTTNLVITNISTSLEVVSNAVLFGGTSNYIGSSNVVFSTNMEIIDGTNVTIGTNTATVESGTNANSLTFDIGTNTTVTLTTLTNAVGEITGTNYAFVINALDVVPTTTNQLGTASWVIYNPKTSPKITPISTNVYFDIHTDTAYDDGSHLAYIHGETITKNDVIRFGTTDEIRTLILSNSTWQIKLQGYAHGHLVPVSLGGSDVAYSQDYNWAGSGDGTTTDAAVVVIDGAINEDYFKFLK